MGNMVELRLSRHLVHPSATLPLYIIRAIILEHLIVRCLPILNPDLSIVHHFFAALFHGQGRRRWRTSSLPVTTSATRRVRYSRRSSIPFEAGDGGFRGSLRLKFGYNRILALRDR